MAQQIGFYIGSFMVGFVLIFLIAIISGNKRLTCLKAGLVGGLISLAYNIFI